MQTPPNSFRTEPVLGGAFLALIAMLFVLRIYAGFWTTPVRTWDDVGYRKSAEEANTYYTANGGLMAAVRLALRPHPYALGGRRSLGYVSWLVVARQALPDLNPEHAYQLANVLMLFVQAALVFYLFRAGGWVLGAGATCLYLLTPFVFGVNRWVWTENHVMTALLGYAAVGIWLLSQSRKAWWKETLLGVSGGLLCGVMAATREYVAPSVVLIPVAILGGLLVGRRWITAASFAIAALLHYVAFAGNMAQLVEHAVSVAALSIYFHPIPEFTAHCVRYVAGFPLSALLVVGMGAVAVVGRGQLRKRPFDPLALLLFAQIALVLIFVALVFYATNRDRRAAVPVAWSVIGAAAVALRLVGPLSERARLWLYGTAASAVGVALVFFTYDLFFAYDGGASFVAHGITLNTAINHPLWLPPPTGEGGMHVTMP